MIYVIRLSSIVGVEGAYIANVYLYRKLLARFAHAPLTHVHHVLHLVSLPMSIKHNMYRVDESHPSTDCLIDHSSPVLMTGRVLFPEVRTIHVVYQVSLLFMLWNHPLCPSY